MYQQYFVRSTVLNGFSSLVKELGGCPEDYYEQAKIDCDQVADKDYFFPYIRFAELLKIAAGGLMRPDFGMRFAFTQNHEILGPIAFLVASANTVGNGLSDVAKYLHHLSPAISLHTQHGKKAQVCIDILGVGKTEPALAVEHHIAAAHSIIRELVEGELRVFRVYFRHERLAPAEAYEQFFQCPVLFSQKRNAIEVDEGLLREKIVSANSGFHKLVENYLATLSSDIPAGLPLYSLPEQVLQLIEQLMPSGKLSRSNIASTLGMNERSLHRKLRAENVTYESLLESARRQEVARLLRAKSLPMSQVAGLLGYREQSSFNRAFKRWYGVTPRQFLAAQD